MKKNSGKIWKFGNNIDTDQMLPSQYLMLENIEEMKKYAFESIDKDFSRKVVKGDLIVAGKNFGCGSSREQAPSVLKSLGIDLIIAHSFAGIFFRNAINIGLPVLICDNLYKYTKTGEVLKIDIKNGIILHITGEYACTKMPKEIIKIINYGGLINYTNSK